MLFDNMRNIMGDNGFPDSDKEVAPRQLYVEFELKRPSASSCPLDEFGSDFQGTRQRIVNGECHTDTEISTDGCGESCEQCQSQVEVVHTVSNVSARCFCPVFEQFGCIPKVTDVTDERVRVETYLPDRELLSELVDALKSVSEELHLRRLKQVESRPKTKRPETAVLSLDAVTQKQRETAIKAVSVGYYASPREASLGELADDIGISKSACSQRLNAVESKLATSVFAGMTDDSSGNG